MGMNDGLSDLGLLINSGDTTILVGNHSGHRNWRSQFYAPEQQFADLGETHCCQ